MNLKKCFPPQISNNPAENCTYGYNRFSLVMFLVWYIRDNAMFGAESSEEAKGSIEK